MTSRLFKNGECLDRSLRARVKSTDEWANLSDGLGRVQDEEGGDHPSDWCPTYRGGRPNKLTWVKICRPPLDETQFVWEHRQSNLRKNEFVWSSCYARLLYSFDILNLLPFKFTHTALVMKMTWTLALSPLPPLPFVFSNSSSDIWQFSRENAKLCTGCYPEAVEGRRYTFFDMLG